MIREILNSSIVPSFGAGFARHELESAAPSLWRGLVGCWCPFMGPQGNVKLLDFGPNRIHGVMANLGSGAWVYGPRGAALNFAAGSELLTLGTSLCDLNKSFSIFAYAKFANATSNTYSIVSASIGGSGADSYFIFLPRALTPGLTMQYDTGAAAVQYTGVPSRNITANTWHMCGLVRDKDFPAINIYQDDDNVYSNPSFSITNDDAVGQTWCGFSWSPAGNVANASFDMILIYDRAIRPEEQRAIAAGLTPLHTAEGIYDLLKASSGAGSAALRTLLMGVG